MGSDKERLAADYLQAQGYKILYRNYRCRMGEVDVIARDGEYLCFVEVKYRSTTQKGAPELAVNHKKQERICRVADDFLLRKTNSCYESVRFDVVAILGEQMTLYKNAFAYIER